MNICSHTLVKNEERFVWYSVMSVIEHVDKALIWDTGSTDDTPKIVEEIKKRYPTKVDFKEVGGITNEQFTKIRQEMLDETQSDWLLVVDGDEIWWDESIKTVVDFIRTEGENFESVVVPTYNLVGDIYHYQEEKAGNYTLAGRTGHLALRGINRNISGLHSDKPHGTWGWVDGKGKMIQDRNENKIKFLQAPYLHTTFLQRTGDRKNDLNVPKRKNKLKREVGVSFPLDFYYPEVLFRDRPDLVESPWKLPANHEYLTSLIQTPLRKVKRRLIKSKTGY